MTSAAPSLFPTSIFAPASTPASRVFELSTFVMIVTAVIFVVVSALLIYVVVRFAARTGDGHEEPPQVYGSNQVELAWTVIPILIVLALFMAAASVIDDVQKVAAPEGALGVTAIGHQYWWEFRYPKGNVVTANELHLPASDPAHPTPAFLTLLSADVVHSFWVPRLAGKTDLIPNRVNRMWVDPHEPGLYLGQCAQYCGTQHGKMFLRVYVEPPEAFERWLAEQSQPAHPSQAASEGQRIFESTACVDCHTITGTAARGRFGPNLTHLMSRETIGAGAVPNTPENLRHWIQDPDSIKPGSKMPAMGLSSREYDALASYLQTLR
jgi:cytochrome c oxidase subunit 2